MLAAIHPRMSFHLGRLAGREQPRVVFLHIPKCAGTSINHHFKTNFGGSRTQRSVMLDSVSGNTADPTVLERAKKAFYVCGHFGWSALEQVREGGIAFTVLREPFDRLRALYLFARKPRRIGNPAFAALAQAAGEMSFEEFCLSNAADVRPFVDNAMARTLAHDYFPICDEIASADIGLAKRHIEELDFVVDAEQLSQTLPRIADMTRTILVRGQDWRNRTGSPEHVAITRDDFLRDSKLSARIAQDLEVHEHARSLML